MQRLVIAARWATRLCKAPPHSRLAVPAALICLLAGRVAERVDRQGMRRGVGRRRRDPRGMPRRRGRRSPPSWEQCRSHRRLLAVQVHPARLRGAGSPSADPARDNTWIFLLRGGKTAAGNTNGTPFYQPRPVAGVFNLNTMQRNVFRRSVLNASYHVLYSDALCCDMAW